MCIRDTHTRACVHACVHTHTGCSVPGDWFTSKLIELHCLMLPTPPPSTSLFTHSDLIILFSLILCSFWGRENTTSGLLRGSQVCFNAGSVRVCMFWGGEDILISGLLLGFKVCLRLRWRINYVSEGHVSLIVYLFIFSSPLFFLSSSREAVFVQYGWL